MTVIRCETCLAIITAYTPGCDDCAEQRMTLRIGRIQALTAMNAKLCTLIEKLIGADQGAGLRYVSPLVAGRIINEAGMLLDRAAALR